MQKLTREERETIILYDDLKDEWTVFSTVPKHIRLYRDRIKVVREEFYADGTEKLIDGIVEGSVSVRKKRKITNQQRKEMAERLAKARNKQNQN